MKTKVFNNDVLSRQCLANLREACDTFRYCGLNMIVKHSPSEFYYPKNLETLDAETETGRAFYFQKPSTGALGRCATSALPRSRANIPH